MRSEQKRAVAGAALALGLTALSYLANRPGPQASPHAEASSTAAGALEPHAVSLERTAPGASASPPGATPSRGFQPPNAVQRERARKAREQIQEAARRWAPTTPPRHASGAAPGAAPIPPVLDRDYIQQHIRDDFFPLARTCYESLLAQQPSAAGTVEIRMAVAGDESMGGVVESVDLGEASTMQDPEFLDCVRESMMSMLFEPPPAHGRVTIVYPVMFAPGDAG